MLRDLEYFIKSRVRMLDPLFRSTYRRGAEQYRVQYDALYKKAKSPQDGMDLPALESLQSLQSEINITCYQLVKAHCQSVLEQEAEEEEEEEEEEEKEKTNLSQVVELPSTWSKEQIFIQPGEWEKIKQRLNEMPTGSEKAAACKIASKKTALMRRHYGEYRNYLWGEHKGFPLSDVEYSYFLHSPAVGLMPIADFKHHEIDVRSPLSQTIASGCKQLTDTLYQVELQLVNVGSSKPKTIALEIDARMIRLYGGTMGQVFQELYKTRFFDDSYMEFANSLGAAPMFAFSGTILERLASAAWDMHQMMNCSYSEACRYIACGDPTPRFEPLQVEGTFAYFAPFDGVDKIDMSIAPYVSPQTVKRAYELVWNQYHGAKRTKSSMGNERVRSMSDTTSKIYIFVIKQVSLLKLEMPLTLAHKKQIFKAWSLSQTANDDKKFEMGDFWQAFKAAEKYITEMLGEASTRFPDPENLNAD